MVTFKTRILNNKSFLRCLMKSSSRRTLYIENPFKFTNSIRIEQIIQFNSTRCICFGSFISRSNEIIDFYIYNTLIEIFYIKYVYD